MHADADADAVAVAGIIEIDGPLMIKASSCSLKYYFLYLPPYTKFP